MSQPLSGLEDLEILEQAPAEPLEPLTLEQPILEQEVLEPSLTLEQPVLEQQPRLEQTLTLGPPTKEGLHKLKEAPGAGQGKPSL